jgi:hypothetical protein
MKTSMTCPPLRGRCLRRMAARLAGLTVLALAACAHGVATAGHPASSAANPAASSATSGGLSVTSTLDGRSALPHRIHWQAFPNGPSADVSEVDFLIDGKLDWVEHKAPYYYGDDGNYLVTSFLAPGQHAFTVRAISATGQTATDTVRAQVSSAPTPPAALEGTWQRFQVSGGASGPPAGMWRLVISSVGWRINDPGGGSNLLDVAYLSPGLLEIRQGMFTSLDESQNGNGWCNDAPGPTIGLRYSVVGKTLIFTPVGPLGCDGTDYVTGPGWHGNWIRTG